MKPIFNFLLFCFSLTLFAQNISGKITYNVSYNLTIELATKRNEAIGRKISQRSIDKINNARNILAFLEFNEQYSIQNLDAKLINDGYKGVNNTRFGAGNKNIYFTDNTSIRKNYIINCRTLGECFLIEQSKPIWEVTQETKIIGSYLCYKAIYKNPLYQEKKPVAWFTTKIPARYSPKFFSGLPGLILELEDNTVTFTAIKIEINPKEKIKIKKPKGIQIKQKKYDALLRKNSLNFTENGKSIRRKINFKV